VLKLIAIFVVSSTLSVAVETESGYVERDFPNTPDGAQQLIAFAEESVGEPEHGVRLVIGIADDKASSEHITTALADLGISYGLVSPEEVGESVKENQLPGPSAQAVAFADEKKFGRIYRRKE
jgi:hypothetical protein